VIAQVIIDQIADGWRRWETDTIVVIAFRGGGQNAVSMLKEPTFRVENDLLHVFNDDVHLVLTYDDVMSVLAINRTAVPKNVEGRYL
jgi:hypothetical protein